MTQSNALIETLFFKCYYAYLKGNLGDTTMYYALLKEEFRIEGLPNALNVHYMKELAKVRRALDGGSVSSKEWLNEPVRSVEGSPSEMPQKDLVKRIYLEGTTQLKEILDAEEDFYLYSIEHPCDQYGFVDMYYRDKKTAFPLEVKVGAGDHKLIGQIMKYDLYSRLHLHEKAYVQVQAVTLCGSYDEYTISELKKNGVIPVLYSEGKTLKFSRL